MEAAIRTEGIPCLHLWDEMISIFGKRSAPLNSSRTDTGPHVLTIEEFLTNVDYIPPTLPPSSGKARLYLFEDNDGVGVGGNAECFLLCVC